MSRLVFISGIGADRRAFTRLKIAGDHEVVFAEWLPNTSKKEGFEAYCERMIKEYEIVQTDVVIGLSFGGFVAQQIAHLLGNERVVLISTFRNKRDLQPFFYHSLRYRLNVILPSMRLPFISGVIAYFLNSKQSASRHVLNDMMNDADFKFINWAIGQIGAVDLSGFYQSHYLSFTGTKDKLVSDWQGPNHHSISGGTHFMVHDAAHILADHIERYLET